MTYPVSRNYGCRLITEGTLKGMRTVVLENQKLRITVLVDKGSDIWEFLYKPMDIDFMWRSPLLLKDPRFFVPTSSSDKWGFWFDYLEGGWQEILPSAGPASSYKGADFGLHGESSTIPWEFRVLEDRPEKVSVVFWARMYRSPFYIEKTLTLEEHSSILNIEEVLVNEGRESMKIVWGHHPTLGEAFINENCVIDTDAKKIHVIAGLPYEKHRFDVGKSFDWPIGISKEGKKIDISIIPKKQNNTGDMLYLSGLKNGWVTVTDLKRELGFGLVWPVDVFPYIWIWLVCGGAFGYPFYGRNYNIALEPFTSLPGPGIAEAVKNKSALELDAGEEIRLHMQAIVFEGAGRVKFLSKDGKIERS